MGAPGVLEVLEFLLLLQIILEGFLCDAIVFYLWQGGVVLMVCTDIPDVSLDRF
jgi:hypothetical protein